VALVRLLVSGANLLLLDEPTNHLEIEAQEALEKTLAQYPGTIVLISHDRAFLGAIAPQKVVEL
jgi:ATP-binding cassette subfamily F protein 3